MITFAKNKDKNINMTKFYSKLLVGCLLVIISMAFNACSKDNPEEDFSNVTGVEKESWNSPIVCNPEGETLELSFTAHASWNLEYKDSWYKPMPKSGNKGSAKVTINVDKNTTGTERTSEISIHVKGYKSVSLNLKQDKIDDSKTDAIELNTVVDKILSPYYLWNDEYKTLNRDLTIPYESVSDNFMKTTLLSMKTNTLDKKWHDSYKDYYLYSYWMRMDAVNSRTSSKPGVNHGIEKEGNVNSYGFSRIATGRFVDELNNPTGKYFYAVESVYPTSPAKSLNIHRGTMIVGVEGKTITEDNFYTHYYELLSPTKKTLSLIIINDSSKLDTIQIMPVEIDPTPIIKNMIIEEGTHKIGYLVYEGFEAGYDDELLEVLGDFSKQGITDLVLDFRYNGGGHICTAAMLSACIAGTKCKDQIFQYYRYNDGRMANVSGTQRETGMSYDSSAKYFYEKFMYPNYFGVNLNSYSLNLNKVYVLTTAETASASEGTINSLRGIGVDVVVIGDKTNGKCVGMENFKFDHDGYSYLLAPITFQFYNAKKETVPVEGLEANHKVADWDTNGYIDFGKKEEPMLAKAIELITGKAAVTSRSISKPVKGIRVEKPYTPMNHQRNGALLIKPNIDQSN